jgi:hypothetical protein
MAVKCSRVNAEKMGRADYKLDFDVANVAVRSFASIWSRF